MRKGRVQISRRFSLQPSSTKQGQESGKSKNDRVSEADAGSTEKNYKIVLMGSGNVGKTAVVHQFLNKTFPEKHMRTVDEMHPLKLSLTSTTTLNLEILDTTGSIDFPAMRNLYIQSADAFVLVYDVNQPATFEEVKDLRNQILNAKKSVPPIVIVGNKLDLVKDEQKVDSESTRKLVCGEWNHGFVEISARDHMSVVQVFKKLMEQANLKWQPGRRQSLPPPQHMNSRNSSAQALSQAQINHLLQIRESSEPKRNSCIIS
ncbi:ras-related protein Rap-2a [Prorops nasuta]|uniref:ras-related protein Rap-2a n=1 Tax=Prorops nasuta TaxID=863751 RepID=UPI0034D00AA8